MLTAPRMKYIREAEGVFLIFPIEDDCKRVGGTGHRGGATIALEEDSPQLNPFRCVHCFHTDRPILLDGGICLPVGWFLLSPHRAPASESPGLVSRESTLPLVHASREGQGSSS
jgi:hypothetical protein